MEITKELIERYGYTFYITQGNNTLTILFGGNLDLYWCLYHKQDKNLTSEEMKQAIYEESKYTFTITKENYFLYSLFDELYNDVKDSKIFLPSTKAETNLDSEDDFDIWNYLSPEEINKKNEQHKNKEAYRYLFNKEQITWHSDDDMYERANKVIIKKENDTFVLEFIRPRITDNNFIHRTPGCISIRFRNSGSRYDPYNVIFMRMFNKLQEYDPKNHQIHLEEILYQKKLTLKK